MPRKIYHARLMYARPFIDSLDFARNGQRISAQVPFAELPRLQELLDNPQGVLDFTLQGGLDSLGRPILDVSMKGSCQLRCQRCLGALDYAIAREMRLLLCDQAALDELDSEMAVHDDEEDFDEILADENLDVLMLLEDEILLGLPIAPKHDPGACQLAEGNSKQEDQHPFAILEKLKRN